MVVKRVFPPVSRQPIFGRTLTAAERSALAAEIRALPEQFVGQEEVELSTSPIWSADKIEPRSLVLRMLRRGGGES
jgi:uncharacterized circularly permuted ATP-grasp superfamily protein